MVLKNRRVCVRGACGGGGGERQGSRIPAYREFT